MSKVFSFYFQFILNPPYMYVGTVSKPNAKIDKRMIYLPFL